MDTFVVYAIIGSLLLVVFSAVAAFILAVYITFGIFVLAVLEEVTGLGYRGVRQAFKPMEYVEWLYLILWPVAVLVCAVLIAVEAPLRPIISRMRRFHVGR